MVMGHHRKYFVAQIFFTLNYMCLFVTSWGKFEGSWGNLRDMGRCLAVRITFFKFTGHSFYRRSCRADQPSETR